MVLFTKEYFPVSVLCFLSLIFTTIIHCKWVCTRWQWYYIE
jgi:hypothetical protein